MRVSPVLVVVVGACGGAAPNRSPPIEHHVAPAPAPRMFRQLQVGELTANSHRQTFVLSIDGERVTLVETDELGDAHTIAIADRAPHWKIRATHTYTGVRHGAELELATSDMQALALHCVPRTVEVAAAGARRARSASPPAERECDRGVWDPPGLQRVDVLVCIPAGQSDADADDDDRLVFGTAPGIEWAYENDDCAMQGGGLRRALPR